ncbi:hypothetical protein ACHAWT_002580 [Skeletonema menzelii]
MMGLRHSDDDGGGVVTNNTAANGVCDKEWVGKRISFNDSESGGNLSSSLPVKKRFKSAVATEDQPSVLLPGINDVLLGKGSTCFDHIGNRRFRVLVEVNVDSYFDGDIELSKVQDTSSKTSKQDDIINNVLSSIQGNRPSGRFLLPIGKSEERCSIDVNSSLNEISWRVASNEEARQKVHVTFMAAGRFFIKRDHIFDKIKRASEADEDCEDCAQLNDEDFGFQTSVELGCSSAQTKGTAKIAHTQTDEATNDARNFSSASNLNQPTSFSRILHSSISQKLCSSNGLRNNYIPAMVSTLQSIPIEKFFMPDERDNPSSAEAITHPAAFIVPSNFDVLCGSGQAFFHHIGNRRFRIMIEMNMERYEQEYHKVGRGENFAIHEIVAQILESIANRCDPRGRFLAMDMQTGWWRVLSPMYSQLKVEQSLLQCMQVKQRAEKQRVQDLVLEAAKQKDQIAAAMKAVSIFYQNEVEAGSYKPKRKRKKSTSLANGQESNIFFPSGLGDKDELIKAQEHAKESLQRKSATVNTSNVNERGRDSQDADDSSSILDAVSGMITLSRRGSSTDNV